MQCITITIGRNVGDVPMTTNRWQSFRSNADYALRELVGFDQPYELHEGVGEWNGVREDSHKVTVLLKEPIDAFLQDKLRARLAMLADSYRQDAIALTISESELIAAREAAKPESYVPSNLTEILRKGVTA